MMWGKEFTIQLYVIESLYKYIFMYINTHVHSLIKQEILLKVM